MLLHQLNNLAVLLRCEDAEICLHAQ
jgi:hypothetical protein